jgi:hypothetical protein
MIQRFIRFTAQHDLNTQPADCMCCTYQDKHTEMAWMMWQWIWRAQSENRASSMGRDSDPNDSVSGNDDIK